MSQPTCLYPPCEKGAVRRGLCGTHYAYLCSLRRKGQWSWEDLEASGKCLPAKGRTGTKGAFQEWLKS